MAERHHEVALTPDEVDTILRHCGPDSLLVGGQALAFWALHYEIEPPGALSTKITSDADFIGTAADARRLGAAMKWKVWIATLDDATVHTAKVTAVNPAGGVKQVDYLSGIVGLQTDRIQARAASVELSPDLTIRILHPLDVLESRLRNLDSLPEKRNTVGVAQAELAIAVARAYIGEMVDNGTEFRDVSKSVERIVKIALDPKLVGVAIKYELDPLRAVPLPKINNREFNLKRWPQIVAAVDDLRRKRIKLNARRSALTKK